MNYWERWIGDWKRKTAHLSMEQKGAYGELLDHCYATHKPIPLDHEHACRIAGAHSQTERAAVEIVLGQFFQKTSEGYINKRVQEEISKRMAYVETQRDKARARWDKEKPQQPEKKKSNGGWWHTEDGIKAKGNELGIPAKIGESWAQYKSRLFDHINAQEKTR